VGGKGGVVEGEGSVLSEIVVFFFLVILGQLFAVGEW
jgi:hypothetical protein